MVSIKELSSKKRTFQGFPDDLSAQGDGFLENAGENWLDMIVSQAALQLIPTSCQAWRLCHSTG